MPNLTSRIVDVLEPIDPVDPWCFLETLWSALDDVPHNVIEAELKRLEDANTIITDTDPRLGARRASLCRALTHPKYVRELSRYDHMRDATIEEVRRRGHEIRWSPKHGWRVPNGQRVICYGPMHDIAKWLEIEIVS
jgi:hypothetical protein